MARTRQQRQHKLIGFKAYIDEDADLIDWWESIPAGNRSTALRDLMRIALGYIVPPQTPQARLDMISEDIAVMRDTINDLPAYIEQVIHYVSAQIATQFGDNGALLGVPDHANRTQGNGKHATAEDVQRREQRMKRKQW